MIEDFVLHLTIVPWGEGSCISGEPVQLRKKFPLLGWIDEGGTYRENYGFSGGVEKIPGHPFRWIGFHLFDVILQGLEVVKRTGS